MFYSRQAWAFLVESISNYVLKEDEKINFVRIKIEVIAERCSAK